MNLGSLGRSWKWAIIIIYNYRFLLAFRFFSFPGIRIYQVPHSFTPLFVLGLWEPENKSGRDILIYFSFKFFSRMILI